MVLNRILAHRIVPLEGQRLPEGFRHAGQGRLDIEAILASRIQSTHSTGCCK